MGSLLAAGATIGWSRGPYRFCTSQRFVTLARPNHVPEALFSQRHYSSGCPPDRFLRPQPYRHAQSSSFFDCPAWSRDTSSSRTHNAQCRVPTDPRLDVLSLLRLWSSPAASDATPCRALMASGTLTRCSPKFALLPRPLACSSNPKSNPILVTSTELFLLVPRPRCSCPARRRHLFVNSVLTPAAIGPLRLS
jgi:hypothetical protein